MSFLAQCRAATEPVWAAYEHHPWIEALAAGALAPEQFAFFQLDDGAHVAEFNRTMALGIAKAPTGHSWAAAAAHVLDDLSTVDELDEKRSILDELGFGVPPQPDLFACSPAREGYVNHLVRVGYEGTFPEIAMALFPCSMFTQVIGNRFRDVTIPGPPAYQRWADMYIRATRTRMCAEHMAVVEDAAGRADAGGRRRLQLLYTRSLEHQVRVFDAAWQLDGSWPGGARAYARTVIENARSAAPAAT